jgi:hypothetical protein
MNPAFRIAGSWRALMAKELSRIETMNRRGPRSRAREQAVRRP